MVQERRRYLTVAQAAAALGLNVKTIRIWADRGLIPHVRTPSGYRRFEPEVIEAFRAEMEVGGGRPTPGQDPGAGGHPSPGRSREA